MFIFRTRFLIIFTPTALFSYTHYESYDFITSLITFSFISTSVEVFHFLIFSASWWSRVWRDWILSADCFLSFSAFSFSDDLGKHVNFMWLDLHQASIHSSCNQLKKKVNKWAFWTYLPSWESELTLFLLPWSAWAKVAARRWVYRSDI